MEEKNQASKAYQVDGPNNVAKKSEKPEKVKLNKVAIVLSLLLAVAIGAAVTFDLMWASERDRADKAVALNEENAGTKCNVPSEKSEGEKANSAKELSEYYFDKDLLVDPEDKEFTYGFSKSFGVGQLSYGIESDTIAVNLNCLDEDCGANNNKYLSGYKTDKTKKNFNFTFDKTIKEVHYFNFSNQAFGYDAIFVSFADGSLEYVPVLSLIMHADEASFVRIDDIKQVVKIYNLSYGVTVEDGYGFLGSGVFAQTVDGSIYNLYRKTKETLEEAQRSAVFTYPE